MISQSVVIGGVELNESEQRELFTAAQQGDMETVAKLQQRTLSSVPVNSSRWKCSSSVNQEQMKSGSRTGEKRE